MDENMEEFKHILFDTKEVSYETIREVRLDLHKEGITFDSATDFRHSPRSRYWIVNYVRWAFGHFRRAQPPIIEWHTDWSLTGATCDDIIAELSEREIPHTVVNTVRLPQ